MNIEDSPQTPSTAPLHESASTNSMCALNIHASASTNSLRDMAEAAPLVRARTWRTSARDFFTSCAQTKYVVASFCAGYLVGFLCAMSIFTNNPTH
jgi:hypothetical protein